MLSLEAEDSDWLQKDSLGLKVQVMLRSLENIITQSGC